MYRRCINIREEAYGANHPLVADALDRLGSFLATIADYDGAALAHRRALEARATVLGVRSVGVAVTMTKLSDVLTMMGHHAESTRLARDAVEIIDETLGRDHSEAAVVLPGLGHTMVQGGRKEGFQGALGLFRQSLRVLEKTYGFPHPQAALQRCHIGMCHMLLYDPQEAHRFYLAAIDEAAQVYGADSYQVALHKRRLGHALIGLRRYEESYAVFKESVKRLERQFGIRHPYVGMALKYLALSLIHI